jgi:hypothetical protein
MGWYLGFTRGKLPRGEGSLKEMMIEVRNNDHQLLPPGCLFQELPTPSPTPRELPYTREWAMNRRVCQESSHWLSPLGRSMMRLHLADSSDIQMERHEKAS